MCGRRPCRTLSSATSIPTATSSTATGSTGLAAKGERVEIKGSEVISNWVKVQDDVWKATVPNSFFGDFNPYSDLIHGDWFNRQGRQGRARRDQRLRGHQQLGKGPGRCVEGDRAELFLRRLQS